MLTRLLNEICAFLSGDGCRNLNRLHPFDLWRGTDTAGYIARWNLHLPPALRRQANAYAAVQPSILFRLLATLRAGVDLSTYEFVDLGCGKGRALLVASECHLARLTGVEADPVLAAAARANMEQAKVTATIVEGDAAAYRPEARHVVVFMYNPFGPAKMRAARDTLAALCREGRIEHLFVIYHNARHADLFDQDPAFSRIYTTQLELAEGERAFGYRSEGLSVIWQAGREIPPVVQDS